MSKTAFTKGTSLSHLQDIKDFQISSHSHLVTFTFERNQGSANLPMWPLGQQGINHSKSDVSLLLGSLHTTLC